MAQTGVLNHQARLKDEDIPVIRRLRRVENWKNESIANKFGVTRKAIYDILHGKTWKHIVEE